MNTILETKFWLQTKWRFFIRALCLLGSQCPRRTRRDGVPVNGHKCACSKKNVGQCWMKSLTEIKLHPTSSNTIQHCPTWPNMVFKRRQHIVANNVGWCCPNMLHPFKRALKVWPVSNYTQQVPTSANIVVRREDKTLPCRTLMLTGD